MRTSKNRERLGKSSRGGHICWGRVGSKEFIMKGMGAGLVG